MCNYEKLKKDVQNELFAAVMAGYEAEFLDVMKADNASDEELIDMAESLGIDVSGCKFDLVLPREVSRFARNTVDALQYTRLLKEKGIEVFFLCDNIRTFDGDGELRLTIMAMLAQDESRKTSIRVRSGMQTARAKGVVYGNGNILGYDRAGKELIINEEQAETVRMIFDQYLSGISTHKIAKNLEEAGRLTSTGLTVWQPGTIGQILDNEFYAGIITYGKEYVTDYLEQKKRVNYGEYDLKKIQGSHTPIITAEEFKEVQQLRAARRLDKDGSMQRHPFGCYKPHKDLIGDLLYCRCGSSVKRTGKDEASLGFRCRVAEKMLMDENGNRKCLAAGISAVYIYAALNYLFSSYFSDAGMRLNAAKCLADKNAAANVSIENRAKYEEEIINALKTAAEKCKEYNITDDILRRFIEKIVFFGKKIEVYLCYNTSQYVLYRDAHTSGQEAEKKVLFEKLLSKEVMEISYHSPSSETHKWKAVEFTVVMAL